jgi:hypothetical protein
MLLSAVLACSHKTDSQNSAKVTEKNLALSPMVLSCSLSLSKGHADPSELSLKEAHSCNDFKINSQHEKDAVIGFCKLAASLEGDSLKLEDAPCSKDFRYATCVVKMDNPTASEAETHYYLGDDLTPGNKALIANDCKNLQGNLVLFNAK